MGEINAVRRGGSQLLHPAGRQRTATGGYQAFRHLFTIIRSGRCIRGLLVVTSWMGEVLVDDPPYVLEVHLDEPGPCWCRLDLVPDAGASTVTLTVASIDGIPAPDVELVRDAWVANLNRL
jgi:hypothetical protein